jgi:hypothetical protein
MSVLDTPIRYELSQAISALERSVPLHFGDINERKTMSSNNRQQVAFEGTRTPFHVAFNGKQLTLVSTVSYSGRGWYKVPIAPTISASCGTDGTKPRLHVVVAIDVDLTRDWRLRTRSRVAEVRPESDSARDACIVTIAHLDVTDNVADALRAALAERLPAIDRDISGLDVRERMDRWYNLLNKSIRIHDSLWLVLAPKEVKWGGMRMDDSALVADVRLFAEPHLVSGPRPPREHTPLPPLERATRAVGDSVQLQLEGVLAYDLASMMLAKEIVGRRVERYGHGVKVTTARVYPLGDGRLVLAVGVAGDVVGDAYFVGTPKLDLVTRTISVPDLDFDVATADALVRGLAWLRKADLVSQLRAAARLPLDPVLDATRRQVEEALNTPLDTGVRLSGHVRTGRLVDVAVFPQGLVVRAEATGALALSINRALEIPTRRTASR